MNSTEFTTEFSFNSARFHVGEAFWKVVLGEKFGVEFLKWVVGEGEKIGN